VSFQCAFELSRLPPDVKHLPKHLQPRWRYLAVRLDGASASGVARGSFQRECWFAAQNLVGDVGSGALDLTVVDFDVGEGEGHAVVRTRRGEAERARAVLACVDAVDGTDLGVRVASVNGTARACRETFP